MGRGRPSLAVGFAVLALTASSAHAAPTITEFSSGLTTNSAPAEIARGKGGAMWFAEWNAGGIGRITPGGSIREFFTGITKGEPRGMALGPDGNIWFTEAGGTDAIGRITNAGAVTEFTTGLTPDSQPKDIVAGSDGALWFTEEQNPGAIGRLDPETGLIVEYSAGLPAGSVPNHITAGPDGNLWFTVKTGPAAIGRITPTGMITLFTDGLTPDSLPAAIAPGPDGNVWFTEAASPGRIGRITPAGVITEWPTPTPDSTPSGIAAGSDGNLWFTERTADQIGRITPAGAIEEYSAGITPASEPFRIASGVAGYLWFTEVADPGRIGRITLPRGKSATAPGRARAVPPKPDAVAPALPPAAKPRLGASVRLRSASGSVVVRLPGSSRYLPLEAASTVPTGSVIDARRGRVKLTSIRDRRGRLQTGTFWGGAFQVAQRRSRRPVTELRLRGPRSCPRSRGAGLARKRRRGRKLWGRDSRGRFRTRGRHGAATVRGTEWLTADRCGATLFRVRRGAVVVRDFGRRRKVLVRAGRSYRAR